MAPRGPVRGFALDRFARARLSRSLRRRGASVDLRGAKTIMSGSRQDAPSPRNRPASKSDIDHGDQIMISPTPTARAQLRLRFALGAVVVMLLGAPSAVDAQGWFRAFSRERRQGNKAAGPVGGVLGGAIGGVVGVFTGVLGVGEKRPGSAGGERDQAARFRRRRPRRPRRQRRQGSQAAGGADPGRRAATDRRADRRQQRCQHRSDQGGIEPHAGAGEELDRLQQRDALSRPQRRRPPQSANCARQARPAGRHHRADAQRSPVSQRSRAWISATSPMPPSRYSPASTTSKRQIFIEEMVRLSHERGLD